MQLSANGLAFEVEEHGAPNGEPLLLVMGLGMQLVGWDADFVAALVGRGFRVIRFDNRDIGLSQQLDHLGVPNLAVESIRYSLGLRIRSPYTLADMADDCAGVLGALGIAKAHVCGASMGGMIAQHLAVRHPARVASLTLMMTSSGARRLPGPSMKARRAIVARPKNPKDMAGLVAHYVRLYRVIGSPAYPFDEAWLEDRLRMALRRAYRPHGAARQMVATVADPDRSPLLGAIRVPTRIVHGMADPLVPVASAHDLAAKIAGAALDLVDGMGHDLPVQLWPRFADAIGAAAARA